MKTQYIKLVEDTINSQQNNVSLEKEAAATPANTTERQQGALTKEQAVKLINWIKNDAKFVERNEAAGFASALVNLIDTVAEGNIRGADGNPLAKNAMQQEREDAYIGFLLAHYNP
jgi:hypothetical protein